MKSVFRLTPTNLPVDHPKNGDVAPVIAPPSEPPGTDEKFCDIAEPATVEQANTLAALVPVGTGKNEATLTPGPIKNPDGNEGGVAVVHMIPLRVSKFTGIVSVCVNTCWPQAESA
jgi:hypothetical protein